MLSVWGEDGGEVYPGSFHLAATPVRELVVTGLVRRVTLAKMPIEKPVVTVTDETALEKARAVQVPPRLALCAHAGPPGHGPF